MEAPLQLPGAGGGDRRLTAKGHEGTSRGDGRAPGSGAPMAPPLAPTHSSRSCRPAQGPAGGQIVCVWGNLLMLEAGKVKFWFAASWRLGLDTLRLIHGSSGFPGREPAAPSRGRGHQQCIGRSPVLGFLFVVQVGALAPSVTLAFQQQE